MDNTSTEGCIKLFNKYNQEALYTLGHAYNFLHDLVKLYEVEIFGEEVKPGDPDYEDKKEDARELAITDHPDLMRHLLKLTLY